MTACSPEPKADLEYWCRALPRPPKFLDSDSDDAGAFRRPTLTAFTSRRDLVDSEKPESADDNESPENANYAISAKSAGDKNDDVAIADTTESFTTATLKALMTGDNECAIEDDDDEDKKVKINLGEDDDLWEDLDGASYNANGTAAIKTAVAVRACQKQQEQQTQQKQQKDQKQQAEQDDGVLIIGGRVKYARNSDGSLVSNLSEQLRQASKLAASAAPTRSGSITSIVSTDVSEASRGRNEHAAGHESPFATGNARLPNPLRCHPCPMTPPRTLYDIGPQSPNPPPPVPPSTPHVVPAPPRSRFNSTSSIQALLTPPMSPTTAVATMATAVATILTSSSGTTSAIALMAVSNASSGTSSGGTSGVSSLASSTLSRATPKVMPFTGPPEPTILHIAQLKRPNRYCTTVNPNGSEVQVLLPFGGCSGPRFVPTVDLSHQVAARSSSSTSSSSNGVLHPRRKLIRSASSDLLHSEMTDSLRKQILDENNSRYTFQYFGTRRFVNPDPVPDETPLTALAPPPVQRTKSTPNVRRVPLPTVPENCKGKEVARGPHGHPIPTFRPVYFVDDYKEPKDWGWERNYHAKGW
ncbi:hypothetical protein SBRCBS47491_003629 [Sporothrix bragantina]|uniref:Uncharacterized protein n=1 Tax=Sporothrix bragantina TaxID=671064 RepID=A0ABP0BHT1_9PEZI